MKIWACSEEKELLYWKFVHLCVPVYQKAIPIQQRSWSEKRLMKKNIYMKNWIDAYIALSIYFFSVASHRNEEGLQSYLQFQWHCSCRTSNFIHSRLDYVRHQQRLKNHIAVTRLLLFCMGVRVVVIVFRHSKGNSRRAKALSVSLSQARPDLCG